MLLQHLYELSLEGPVGWVMFFGFPVGERTAESLRIDMVDAYLAGLEDAADLVAPDRNDMRPFFLWLRDERDEFPVRGWRAKFLEDCGGNHLEATQKLFHLLYEYILRSPPEWFVDLNASPIPSKIRNGLGTPRVLDMRLPQHIEVANKVRLLRTGDS